MISQEKIIKVINKIVEDAAPREIIMFGSYARGTMTENSDLDLLVIEDQLDNSRAEMVRLRRLVRTERIPVDIVPVATHYFNEWKDVVGSLMYAANTEGKVLYEKS